MPSSTKEVEAIEPMYKCLPGWKSKTAGISRFEDLPAGARDYIAFLEKQAGVEVGCISTGPERNETIVRKGSRFAELTGQ